MTGKKKPSKKNPAKLPRIIVSFFFISIAVIYLHNLTRDIYSGDIGDLVTAAAVFGVAHPPGYPLFTFLGYLLTQLPLAIPQVTKVALISTIASLGALYIYYRFALRFSKNLFISLLSTSILAFSYLFWFHAEIPETFGLNNFFVVALIYTAILFYEEKKAKYLYLLGFLAGLSLTHHHTVLFLLPALLVLILRRSKFIFSRGKHILLGILSFSAGLTPYIYVPIAANLNPVINWDSATNLPNFIHLVLRRDYGFAPSVVNEVPIPVKLIHVTSFFKSIITMYSYQVIIVFFIGIFSLLKRDRYLTGCLLLAFLLTGPGFMYYAAGLTGVPVGMGIIERFYVMPAVIFMFFVPSGFALIKSFLDKKLSRPVYSYLLLGYFLIIPVLLINYNFPKTDLSKTKIGNTLADNIFTYLPKNAVLFVSGDTTTFNIWYNHYVLAKRPDLGIINPPGVGGNTFFDDEINRYHEKNPKEKLERVPLKTIYSLLNTRRIFATYPSPFVPPDTLFIPKGLVYEMMRKDAIPDKATYLAEVENNLRSLTIVRRETLAPAEDNLVAAEIPSIYATGLVRIGDFVDSYYKDPAKAEHYYRRALWMDPDHPSAYAGLALVLFKAYKDCTGAETNLREAINLYPVWEKYYGQLYLIYIRCNASEEKKSAFANEYEMLFHKDITKLVSPHLEK